MKQNKCEINGCEVQMFQRLNGVCLCAKHYSQIKSHGEILSRTIYNKNEIIECGEYAYIVLYDKQCNIIEKAIIDSCNINMIRDYKWYLRPDGYVATTNYDGKYEYLHRVICNDNSKHCVDHIDRNKLNNTLANLRVADDSESQMNRGIYSNNTSGKIGVHWNKQNSKWCAMICVRKKHMNLGYFDNYEDAVAARIDAERKYFKEYRVKDEQKIHNNKRKMKEYIPKRKMMCLIADAQNQYLENSESYKTLDILLKQVRKMDGMLLPEEMLQKRRNEGFNNGQLS